MERGWKWKVVCASIISQVRDKLSLDWRRDLADQQAPRDKSGLSGGRPPYQFKWCPSSNIEMELNFEYDGMLGAYEFQL